MERQETNRMIFLPDTLSMLLGLLREPMLVEKYRDAVIPDILSNVPEWMDAAYGLRTLKVSRY